MLLTFLGTAASEGYPHPLCGCANCARARDLGGLSLRKRSAALVNDDLLIDFGPDLIAACQQHGIALTNLRYGLQTHEHADHLAPANFVVRNRSCVPGELIWLDYYATAGTLARLAARFERDLSDPAATEPWRMTVHTIAPFETVTVGPYQVTSVLAKHDPQLVPLLYLIERDGRCLFYATDTGALPDETWQFLEASGRKINLLALDHTFGLDQTDHPRHNTQQTFLATVDRLRQSGLLASDARVFAHHFAHHSNPVYLELVALAAEHGYDVAYDGLRIPV